MFISSLFDRVVLGVPIEFFVKKSKIWHFGQKIEILVKNRKFEIFVKNSNSGQKSKIFSKIEIVAKSRKFSQKSKCLLKNRIFSKIEIFIKKIENLKLLSKIAIKFMVEIEIFVENRNFH